MAGRTLFFGILGGLLLSAMRAPRGLDWTQLQAVDPWTAALFRAAPLLALGMLLDARRAAFRDGLRPVALLLGALLGFALHGFLLEPRFLPESRGGFALRLVVATALLWWAAGPVERSTSNAEEERHPALLERLGLGVAGLGVALALESLAHMTRLLGLGLPEDHTVMGSSFLLLTLLGALAFGRLVERDGTRRLVVPLALALAAAFTLQGHEFVAGMQMDAIFRHLKAVGVDNSAIGGLRADAALSGAAFVGTAFVLGTALGALRHAGRLATVLLGAALGLLLRPALVASQVRAIDLASAADSPWAWRLGLWGVALATGGALLVLALRARGALRPVGIVLALVGLGVFASRPRTVWIFSPWYPAELSPTLAIPHPVGLLTLERVPDGTLVLTLDRHRLTPTAEEEELDRLRIHQAIALLDPVLLAPVSETGPRVLLAGALTPARAEALRQAGVQRFDRTAPWFDVLAMIEDAIFADDPRFAATAPSEGRLHPAEAKRNLERGEYDLVLATPVHGPILSPRSASYVPWATPEAPVLGSLEVPAGTLGVAWLDAASPLAQRDLGHVMFAQQRFRLQSLGAVRGELAPGRSERGPLVVDAGDGRLPVELAERFDHLSRDRHHAMRRALFDRLAAATAGTGDERLFAGLAVHFGAQRMSSPFETLAQRTEFDEEALRHWHADLAGRTTLDDTRRRLWSDVARLLTEKRQPDLVLAYLEDVAQTFGPWPDLDRAVGQAYIELLEPDRGLELFDRVLADEPFDVRLLRRAAEVAGRDGQTERAVVYLDRALELQPGNVDLLRERGILLDRAGDPEARRRLERLFEAHPEDEELASYLYGEEPEEHEH